VRRRLLALTIIVVLAVASCGADPDAGDNPVLGSEGPGAIADPDGTNYPLLVLLALCLIGAGVLLIKVERWQRRKEDESG
jgi:hypothetical protein